MKGYPAAPILRVFPVDFLYGRRFSFQPPAGGYYEEVRRLPEKR
jgi:hypothetical protein